MLERTVSKYGSFFDTGMCLYIPILSQIYEI